MSEDMKKCLVSEEILIDGINDGDTVSRSSEYYVIAYGKRDEADKISIRIGFECFSNFDCHFWDAEELIRKIKEAIDKLSKENQ